MFMLALTSILRNVARRIRHMPGLKNADWLWRSIRRPYYWLLNLNGHGVEVLVGGTAPIRIPAEFSGFGWEAFEPETVAAFAEWVRNNPGGTVLDVGSSIGGFAAVALFTSDESRVVALESDLASVAAARRMCSHATGHRLQLVNCFASDSAGPLRLPEAVAATETALSGLRETSTQYVCLTDSGIESIPRYSLDGLFPEGVQNLLIKCDVEGAELLILRGAQALMRNCRPTLLLSVHPRALPNYGHTVGAVRDFLHRAGYSIRVLAVDHEEHWLCTSC
jgi:FkbM family methyltransferase